MNAEDVVLPRDKNALIKLYLYINEKINEIWKEYVVYSDLKYMPSTTKIFSIIFCEMDFYETVLARIRVHLSDDDMVGLRKHDAVWDW
tara:strand:- start:134 stop:397 length:264 start_codon:yes stop_codon:yes gene_type:complete